MSDDLYRLCRFYFLLLALAAGITLGAFVDPDDWQTYDLDRVEATA